MLLHISDLKTVLPNDVEVAMFADDTSLFCSHPCKLTLNDAMQEAVIRIAELNRHYKMTLNTEKCEVVFITSNLHDARWQPTIHLEGQPLHFTPLPKFLGVTLDHALSFGQHIANSIVKATGRYRDLSYLNKVGFEEIPTY